MIIFVGIALLFFVVVFFLKKTFMFSYSAIYSTLKPFWWHKMQMILKCFCVCLSVTHWGRDRVVNFFFLLYSLSSELQVFVSPKEEGGQKDDALARTSWLECFRKHQGLQGKYLVTWAVITDNLYPHSVHSLGTKQNIGIKVKSLYFRFLGYSIYLPSKCPAFAQFYHFQSLSPKRFKEGFETFLMISRFGGPEMQVIGMVMTTSFSGSLTH